MGKHYPRFLASLLLLLLLCASVLFPMQSQAKENTFVMKESSDHTTRKLSVDPISSRDQYSAVLYDNTNGLPTSEANDIAETSNGFLWIERIRTNSVHHRHQQRHQSVYRQPRPAVGRLQ